MKIAMWSGPRNLSTAMMYAFAARGDCAVWDEPFYAAYLRESGQAHPMAAEIMAAHDTDPARIAATCAGPIPDGKPVFYMKQMPHHMRPGFPLDWAGDCVNVHLIRHPARVIASYAAKNPDISFAEIGFEDQARLYNAFPGPVIDSSEIRANPPAALQALCAETGLPFRETMLTWPKGPKPYDGAWAPHWYNSVHQSTGFADPEGPVPELPEPLMPLLQRALPLFEQMHARRLIF